MKSRSGFTDTSDGALAITPRLAPRQTPVQTSPSDRFNGVVEAATLNAMSASGATEKPLTGCCSSLSAMNSCIDNEDDFHTLCFDCNEDYDCCTCEQHEPVSADAILNTMTDYHGMCASDENIECLVDNLACTESSLAMITRYN